MTVCGATIVMMKTCSIEGCDRPAKARGWCNTHHERWRRHGDPTVVVQSRTVFHPGDQTNLGRSGELSGRWRGDAISRMGAHSRVRARRGSPSQHACAHCGGAAMDWAYDHACPRELTCPRTGSAYSADPAHYLPLCRLCHSAFDRR